MSTTAAKSRPSGDLRAALLDSALRILGEQGTDALSLRAVARRAGVSAMAPYRHYRDRDALLAAVATSGFETLRDHLQAADDQAPDGDALIMQAIAYVRFARVNPALFRVMFQPRPADRDPALAAAGQAAYRVLATRAATSDPARTLGCWSVVHGLAVLYLDGMIAPGHEPWDDVTRQVARAMLTNFQ